MRNQIRLDTTKDVTRFVTIASSLPDDVDITVTDGHFTVNGKSLLGMMYGKVEFATLWMECREDVYDKFKDFIII